MHPVEQPTCKAIPAVSIPIYTAGLVAFQLITAQSTTSTSRMIRGVDVRWDFTSHMVVIGGIMSVVTDTEIYKNTYRELVLWIKELLAMRRDDQTVYDRNIAQAGRIMELEFDLRRYRSIMVDDKQEGVIKEYGVIDSNVISNDELMEKRLKRGGGKGGGNGRDYLAGMEWGTQFYCRPRVHKTWMLCKFLYAGRKKNVFLLVPMKGDENEVSDDREWMPVDSKAFCEYWELIADFPPPKD